MLTRDCKEQQALFYKIRANFKYLVRSTKKKPGEPRFSAILTVEKLFLIKMFTAKSLKTNSCEKQLLVKLQSFIFATSYLWPACTVLFMSMDTIQKPLFCQTLKVSENSSFVCV